MNTNALMVALAHHRISTMHTGQTFVMVYWSTCLSQSVGQQSLPVNHSGRPHRQLHLHSSYRAMIRVVAVVLAVAVAQAVAAHQTVLFSLVLVFS
jgi:hypothetical protein